MQTVAILSDKWSFAILVETYYGVSKFDDYQHNLGISRNILTKRLGTLVDEEILRRVQYQTGPARYEYRLTDKGRAMYPIFLAIQQWGEGYLEADQDHDWHLVHETCGQTTAPHLCCDQCGERVSVSTIRLVADRTAGDPSQDSSPNHL
ncbi:winged helix-turn-helix transcriptional regulator [Gordonia polyisoprenivorans]|uniref:winged helix-turn-helix transcriptional regulator n=1 Tax=Gordonia polyisoprenivorans TaxID=84595 RepID=UPI001AD65BD7|nr:helix-turn-helix domain-containing protein [Gordonia polyisoprenivorans]QTI69035.1 helix-turn-helix transcriptional regulator [Gordonia polyisoprenivorans]